MEGVLYLSEIKSQRGVYEKTPPNSLTENEQPKPLKKTNPKAKPVPKLELQMLEI